MDDAVVITHNKFVEKGIKGIPEIINQDFFKGWESSDDNELSGGRYRPFSLIIFALEYQFFGANPIVSHSINVLLFALLIALLYQLLQKCVFREQNKNLAFITCLLFVVHPIHTEVIANVKSRDELITFILLIVSLTSLIRHSEKPSVSNLLIYLSCFFLALLTRETAIAFIGVAPLILYFFFNQSIKKAMLFCLPLVAVLIGYLTLRFLLIGFSVSSSNNIMNAPFLYATASEAFATKVFILFRYMWLLFFPSPLSCDYGYNQIPYISIYSFQFILSMLLFTGLFAIALYTFRKRSIFSFCILYFLITISLAANFVLGIGTPLAERLLFQPSLAFCIVAAVFYFMIEKNFKVIATGTLLIILLLFSVKTYVRNNEWKNDETLFLADVITAPNSAKTNLIAAEQYIFKAELESDKELKNQYFQKAVYYGNRSLSIYHFYSITYLDLGAAYYGLFDYFKAADLWIQAHNVSPSNKKIKESAEMLSAILFKEGNKFYEKGNINDAIKCYQKSAELNDSNVEAWYNLGGNYFLLNDSKNAITAWQKVVTLNPNHPLKQEDFYKH